MSKIVKQKISCIVPVFNEGKRVGNVLKALIGHPLLDEVIVVNDGSSDDSEEILKKIKGINLISYSKNKGKSFAVMTGMKQAKNDLLLMIDSDLQGLTAKDITDLVEPVIEGKADVAMTLRKNSLKSFKMMGLDFVSGERIFSRKMIPKLDDLGKLTCFGLESHLNNLIVKNGARLAVVNWKNVITPRKSVKFGLVEGTWRDLKMVGEIVKYLGVKGIYKQIRGMKKLIVK
ncbi:MAG: glycosyltransferase family 2 protein [Candidatus Peregrinibacteria bacterium]|nr:glycosyltransferase family 2 protein [Candidatus Peregrinibacteria bacterium]